MRWVAYHIAEQGLDPKWISMSVEPIVKASLSFAGKFWWVVMRSQIQPTLANNALISICAVLVVSILDGYEIYWAHLIEE